MFLSKIINYAKTKIEYQYSIAKLEYQYSIAKLDYYIDFSGLVRKFRERITTQETIIFSHLKQYYDVENITETPYILFHKPISDNNNITDIINNYITKISTDTIQSFDSIPIKTPQKNIVDIENINEELSINCSLRSLSDYENIIDTPYKHIFFNIIEGPYVLDGYVDAGYFVLEFNIEDYLNPFRIGKGIIDNKTINDSLNPFRIGKGISEPVNILETISNRLTRDKFTDTYSVSDVTSKNPLKYLTDNLSEADSLNPFNIIKGILDIPTAIDNIKSFNITHRIIENEIIDDYLSFSGLLNIRETNTILDYLSTYSNIIKSDENIIVDQIIHSPIKILNDYSPIIDILSTSSIKRNIDSAGVIENISGKWFYLKIEEGPYTFEGYVDTNYILNEGLTVSDSPVATILT